MAVMLARSGLILAVVLATLESKITADEDAAFKKSAASVKELVPL